MNPEDLSVEAHSVRRRVMLWRRAALFLIFVIMVITAVLWQRGVMLRDDCRVALEHYAQLAKDGGLTETDVGLLQAQWDNLDHGTLSVMPARFTLIKGNWSKKPGPEDHIPLAFTSDACSLVFTEGRHVLFRDEDGLYVEWMTEAQVQPIIQQARPIGRATSRTESN